MKTFKELGLNSEIMKSLDDLGFEKPSPIQEAAIPFVLESKQNLIALAQTGTGKTAGFALPIVNQMKGKDLQSIIICPTRELCLQISEDIKKFTKYSKQISTTAVYGGERIDNQIRALKRGTNIVVGTPGRVCDLIRRGVLKLNKIQWLVLDEADEMLDMGFKEDLDAILEQTPEEKQTLLFSATLSRRVHTIAKKYMKDAHEISVGEKNVGSDQVTHEYYVVKGRDRFAALRRILDSLPGVYGILFCRTRHETQEVADKLKQANYNTDTLHGDISQNMRTQIMNRFKKKKIQLLVATDVAARGIDVDCLTHVINYNLPDQNEAYTHRSGRTGRADNHGVSICIVTPREIRVIKQLESIIGKPFEHKKVPSGKEICANQMNSFLDEIENTDTNHIEDANYLEEIEARLSKMKKADLIRHLVANQLGHLMKDYENVSDLNASVKDSYFATDGGNYATFKMNVGKKDGLNIKEFFALINSTPGLEGVDLGQINLLPNDTVFSIEKSYQDDIMDSLNGRKYQGGVIKVVTSSENLGGGRSGGRNSRGGGRGRGQRSSRGGGGFRGRSQGRRSSGSSRGSRGGSSSSGRRQGQRNSPGKRDSRGGQQRRRSS